MTVTINIEQACDGCETIRLLADENAGHLGGWREVKPNKHLCPPCIDRALQAKFNVPEEN